MEINQEASAVGARMNALKHGMLCKEVLIEGEDGSLMSDFTESIKNSLSPTIGLEMLLAERIASNAWRLRRALINERSIMELERDNAAEWELKFREDEAKAFKKGTNALIVNQHMEKLTRYEASVERGMYRALHELQRLQSLRKGESVIPPIVFDS